MIYVAAALLIVGSLLSAVAVLGILRFPDVFTRLHAASNAGPLGAGLILLGLAVVSGDWAVAIRCVLGFFFLILTSPVSAHLLARAALRSGITPDSRTSIDDRQINH